MTGTSGSPAATTFRAEPLAATSESLAAQLAPSNPFMTAAYAHAMRTAGFQPWMFVGADANGEQRGAIGFMKSGRLNRALLLPSFPQASRTAPLWDQLLRFCRKQGITQLSLSSAASEGVDVPTIPGETERIPRTEFVIELGAGDIWPGVGKSHRERIKKARKNGLTVERSRGEAALAAHVALHEHSMQRRAARGESVPLDEDDSFQRALLAAGAGELYQATRDGQVLSSLLMVRSETGAYSQSSGNSPEGMTIGASHFLRYETAVLMGELGVRSFFLGGCRAHETGLRSYKEGFGARTIPMTAVEAYIGTGLRHFLSTVMGVARTTPPPDRPETSSASAAEPDSTQTRGESP